MLCLLNKSTYGIGIARQLGKKIRSFAALLMFFNPPTDIDHLFPFLCFILSFLCEAGTVDPLLARRAGGGGGYGTNSNDSKEACYFLGACLSLDKLYNLHTVQYYVHKLFSFIYKYKRISL
jgi:hypothetical protein